MVCRTSTPGGDARRRCLQLCTTMRPSAMRVEQLGCVCVERPRGYVAASTGERFSWSVAASESALTEMSGLVTAPVADDRGRDLRDRRTRRRYRSESAPVAWARFTVISTLSSKRGNRQKISPSAVVAIGEALSRMRGDQSTSPPSRASPTPSCPWPPLPEKGTDDWTTRSCSHFQILPPPSEAVVICPRPSNPTRKLRRRHGLLNRAHFRPVAEIWVPLL